MDLVTLAYEDVGRATRPYPVNRDVCTTTTQRVPNVPDVWNTLGNRCTNVAGLLGRCIQTRTGSRPRGTGVSEDVVLVGNYIHSENILFYVKHSCSLL